MTWYAYLNNKENEVQMDSKEYEEGSYFGPNKLDLPAIPSHEEVESNDKTNNEFFNSLNTPTLPYDELLLLKANLSESMKENKNKIENNKTDCAYSDSDEAKNVTQSEKMKYKENNEYILSHLDKNHEKFLKEIFELRKDIRNTINEVQSKPRLKLKG